MNHEHLIVRCHLNVPPKDPQIIQVWLADLIEKMGMKIMMGPFAEYCNKPGNEGLTAATIIETSHVVLHTWDKISPAIMQLDVYTCSELDLNIIWNKLIEFEPTDIEYKFLDREHGLQIVDAGTYSLDYMRE